MSLLPARRHRIAAGVTALALTAGGGAAAAMAFTAPASAGPAALSAATAPTATSTPPATSTPAARHARKDHRRGLLSRVDYGTFEIRAKGQWVTRTLDRGKVTSVSSSSITLLRPDGHSVTVALGGSTKYGKAGSASALTDGHRALVISQGGTATRVFEGTGKAKAATGSSATSA